MPSSSATTQSRRAPSRLWKTSASAIAFLLLALPAASALAASQPLPLWRVSDGRGHVLYLAGAMHALTPVDYPLPAAMTNAFANSDRLVEELDLAAISPLAAAQTLAANGRLPAGQNLAGAMDDDWKRAQSLAKAGGLDLAAYDKLRPWLAAVEIAEQAVSDAGYRPALGVDQYFASLAHKRGMPVTGLESFEEQIGFFAAMPLATQRSFLLQTLAELPRTASQLERLRSAWRSGDLAALVTIEKEDFAAYPELRRVLLDERNERWLATLKRCLAGATTCFVVVGVEHMVGPKGIIALLRAQGCDVVQLRNVAPSVPGSGARP